MRPLGDNPPTHFPRPDFCIAWESASDAYSQFSGWPMLPRFQANPFGFLLVPQRPVRREIARSSLMHLVHHCPRSPHGQHSPRRGLDIGRCVCGGSRVVNPPPGDCK